MNIKLFSYPRMKKISKNFRPVGIFAWWCWFFIYLFIFVRRMRLALRTRANYPIWYIIKGTLGILPSSFKKIWKADVSYPTKKNFYLLIMINEYWFWCFQSSKEIFFPLIMIHERRVWCFNCAVFISPGGKFLSQNHRFFLNLLLNLSKEHAKLYFIGPLGQSYFGQVVKTAALTYVDAAVWPYRIMRNLFLPHLLTIECS